MTEFFRVISADQFIELLGGFSRISTEHVALDAALHRRVSKDITSLEDLPEQARSTVDGFAVRAEDTFGASDSLPAFLKVVASITMGTMPDFSLRAGQAAQIPTGGFLPAGADAVVMVEYTNQASADEIEVTRPVTFRTNVLERGEDAARDSILLNSGKMIRAQEIGFLAALGIQQIPVYRQPVTAVISSGDELVPIDWEPAPGQIRDANGHAVAALVRNSEAVPLVFEIVPDNARTLADTLEKALAQADVVTMSGGSSVGTRDLMLDVVSGLPEVEILAHGVAIRPGKPTLLARQRGKAIIGLPGHPVSALMVAQVFLAPFLQFLQGGKLEKGPAGNRTQAVLASSVGSTIGLEEFVRVRFEQTPDGKRAAYPVFGKSGMLSTMVKADGVLTIPMNVEGFSKGDVVPVTEF